MEEYIGKPLEEVANILKKKGKQIVLVNNNFNVSGDTELVTNVKETETQIVITYGEFIFNLKDIYAE